MIFYTRQIITFYPVFRSFCYEPTHLLYKLIDFLYPPDYHILVPSIVLMPLLLTSSVQIQWIFSVSDHLLVPCIVLTSSLLLSVQIT